MFSNLHPSLRNAFYGIVTIFLLLFVATYHTFKVALSASNDVVDKNYYQVGLNYEKKILEKEAILKQGYHFEWKSNLQDFKIGKNLIQIQYLKNSESIFGKKIVVLLERKATDKFNQMVELSEVSPGIYQGEAGISSGGEWILTLSTTENGQGFEQRFPVLVN